MTDAVMRLNALLEKISDADMQREMTGFAAERLMALEVGALTGAGYGVKSAERLAQRNAYRERDRRARPTGTGGRARWSCTFRGCARDVASPAFWSRAEWPRRS